VNLSASFPGPRRARSWLDRSRATPPAPGGPDPLWLVVLAAVGLAVAILIVAAAIGLWRSS
jgi:hypothetical protein